MSRLRALRIAVAQAQIGDLVVKHAILAALGRRAPAMQDHRLDAMRRPMEIIIAVGMPGDRPVRIRDIAGPAAAVGDFNSHNAIAIRRPMVFQRLEAEGPAKPQQQGVGRVVALRFGRRHVERHVGFFNSRHHRGALRRRGAGGVGDGHHQIVDCRLILAELLIPPAAVGVLAIELETAVVGDARGCVKMRRKLVSCPISH